MSPLGPHLNLQSLRWPSAKIWYSVINTHSNLLILLRHLAKFAFSLYWPICRMLKLHMFPLAACFNLQSLHLFVSTPLTSEITPLLAPPGYNIGPANCMCGFAIKPPIGSGMSSVWRAAEPPRRKSCVRSCAWPRALLVSASHQGEFCKSLSWGAA